MTLVGGATRSTTRGAPAATDLYDRALQATAAGSPTDLGVRYRGALSPLPVSRWCGPPEPADLAALDRLCAALPPHADVLDLGCGPGRHTAALHQRGLRALGVDTSPAAVALAQDRGAPAVCADALGPLPGAHHGWDGVLLLNGNLGIGGDPLLLLCRVRDLLRPTGRVLLELDPADITDRGHARLTSATAIGEPFAWARLGAPDLGPLAECARLAVLSTWTTAGRSFALLGVQPS